MEWLELVLSLLVILAGAELYNRRADAESTNRTLENTLYWQRAHSVGHVRQEVDWLGFGLVENALSAVRHRERERLKAAA